MNGLIDRDDGDRPAARCEGYANTQALFGSKLRELFSIRNVPKPNRAVEGYSCKASTVRAEHYLLDQALVPLQSKLQPATCNVPKPNNVVGGATGNEPTVGAYIYGINRQGRIFLVQ